MDNSQPKKPWYERWADHIAAFFAQMWRLIKIPGVPILEMLYDLGIGLRDLVLRFRTDDPFRIKVYGDYKRTTKVRFDQTMVNLMLPAVGLYVFWAWSKGFSMVDASDVVVLMLALLMSVIMLVLERSFAVADLHGKRRLWRFWLPRLALTLVLADFTSVPLRLDSSAEDIEALRSATEHAAWAEDREKKKEAATALATGNKTAAVATIAESPDKVVDRRQARHDEIAARIEAESKKLTDAAAGRGVTRRNKKDVMETLTLQVAASREELRAYEVETERLRSEAEAAVTSELARRDTEDKQDLKDIDATASGEVPEQFRVSRGFYARKLVLDEIESEPDRDAAGNVVRAWGTKAQLNALGCILLMMIPEIITLLWKLLLCSKDYAIYLSRRLQAIGGNPEVLRSYIQVALDQNADSDERQEAIDVLRGSVKAKKDAAAANVDATDEDAVNAEVVAALQKLGYDGTESMTFDEVTRLKQEHGKAQTELNDTNIAFREAFRAMCERREGNPAIALPRHRLNQEAERLWRANVAPKSLVLDNAEYQLREKDITPPAWPSMFESRSQMLWRLEDRDLIELFGWSTPDYERYRSTHAQA